MAWVMGKRTMSISSVFEVFHHCRVIYFISFDFYLQSFTLTAWVLIGSVVTILFAITEQSTLNTIAITACEKTVLTQWLICYEKWLHFSFFILEFAVFDSVFPIACLLFNIKIKTSWTTNGLKTLNDTKNNRNFYWHYLNESKFIELTEVVHWITSRHESPSLATRRNHSPASLSLHSSCSYSSVLFLSSLCRFMRTAFAEKWE